MDTLSRTLMKPLARLAIACLAALAISCVLLAGSASPAHAAGLTLDNAKGSVGISTYYYGEVRGAAGSKDTISDLTCSNDKVIRIRAFNNNRGFHVVAKKVGRANVTYTYKGKKHKVKFIVYKYENPAKKLKVGQRDYAAKFKKYEIYRCSAKEANTFSGKLTVKPAKGWKLKGVRYTYADSPDPIQLGNGQRVLWDKDFDMRLTFRNKKTGVVEELMLYAYTSGGEDDDDDS